MTTHLSFHLISDWVDGREMRIVFLEVALDADECYILRTGERFLWAILSRYGEFQQRQEDIEECSYVYGFLKKHNRVLDSLAAKTSSLKNSLSSEYCTHIFVCCRKISPIFLCDDILYIWLPFSRWIIKTIKHFEKYHSAEIKYENWIRWFGIPNHT